MQRCQRVGWLAHISPAALNDNGEVVSGVAVLVRNHLDIGVASMSPPDKVDRSRLTGVLLDMPGMPRVGLLSAYFKAGGGLGEVNLGLLADIAIQQDLEKIP